MKRKLGRIAAALALSMATSVGVAATAACTGTNTTAVPVNGTPTAFGVQDGPIFDCYYADDPQEVTNLINAGYCPFGSAAVAMPLTWRETWWAYYSSPRYYNTYIPPAYRVHYSTVYVVSFQRTYKTQITAAERNARYSTVKPTFGGGASIQRTFGGGLKPAAPSPDGKPQPARTFGGGKRVSPPVVVPR